MRRWRWFSTPRPSTVSIGKRVILHEEERFSNTLQYGIRVLDEEIERIKEANETTLPGTVAFKLHDIGEAGYFADNIVMLREGRVLQRGRLEELLNSPADPFITRFINAQRGPFESIGGGKP